MSWNVDFTIGGGGRRVERIDERIIRTPGREIIEETITRGPYRERYEETIITGGPRREIIEERVVVGPGRREIIEERVIVDRPGDSYYSRGYPEPPPPYSVSDRVHMMGRPVLPVQMPQPVQMPKPYKPVMAGTFTPGKVIRRPESTSSRTTTTTTRKSLVGWAPPGHCRGTVLWAEANNGMVPGDAVKAGIDKDGSPIYAGRAWHQSDLLPAKVTPSHGCAYVCWGGEEIKKYTYEVLISHHIAWVEESNGRVPAEAIPCGHTSDGERLYLGRCMHDGTLTVGKVHPSHHCIYIPYGGREISHRDYEVLVIF